MTSSSCHLTFLVATLLRDFSDVIKHLKWSGYNFKAHASGPNTVGPNNVVTCCIRLHGSTTMLALVAYSLKPVKLLAQQVPTFLLFCDRRSVAQQCCVRLHGTATMLANVGLVKMSAHAPCNICSKNKQS